MSAQEASRVEILQLTARMPIAPLISLGLPVLTALLLNPMHFYDMKTIKQVLEAAAGTLKHIEWGSSTNYGGTFSLPQVTFIDNSPSRPHSVPSRPRYPPASPPI